MQQQRVILINLHHLMRRILLLTPRTNTEQRSCRLTSSTSKESAECIVIDAWRWYDDHNSRRRRLCRCRDVVSTEQHKQLERIE